LKALHPFEADFNLVSTRGEIPAGAVYRMVRINRQTNPARPGITPVIHHTLGNGEFELFRF